MEEISGRTLKLTLRLIHELTPLAFCLLVVLALALASLFPGLPVVSYFAEPYTEALLAVTWVLVLVLAVLLILTCRLVLGSLRRVRTEQKRILFLSLPGLMLQLAGVDLGSKHRGTLTD